jgi:hypothetical protein
MSLASSCSSLLVFQLHLLPEPPPSKKRPKCVNLILAPLTLSGQRGLLARNSNGQGDCVQTVRVKMRAVDLPLEMIAMRRWLDYNKYEVTRFDCNRNGQHVIVSVDLTSDTAAAAFAAQFDGESSSPATVPMETVRSNLRKQHANASPAAERPTVSSPMSSPPPD